VDRNGSIPDEERQNNFIEFLKSFYGDQLDQWFPLLKNVELGLSCRERLISFYKNDSSRCVVIGINSASRINGWENCRDCGRLIAAPGNFPCQKCNLLKPNELVPSTIAISSLVAYQVEKLLEPLPEQKRWFRAFVVHHNLFSFDEPSDNGYVEMSVPAAPVGKDMFANSAALQGWLARVGFHLVLHGHKHQTTGRQDTLFRRGDGPEGRRIVVLGAGSAGVMQAHLGTEPLAFFSISTERLSDQRFQIHAKPMKITSTSLAPYPTTDFAAFTCEIGPNIPSPPPIFYAERMVDCHAAITRATGKSEAALLRNFCSIVDFQEPFEFEFPETTRRAGKKVDPKLVRASFLALHPEYDPTTEAWGEADAVHKKLLTIRPRFLFQHGPRMFGPTRESSVRGGDRSSLPSPMHYALSRLKENPQTSHAFVGVFHPAIDATGWMGPPPALAGVQFHVADDVKKQKRLELTFTFRKIDLSFWWVVNMYEAIKLWKWAHSQIEKECRCTSGRITFFATIAEWKTDDTATFPMELDDLQLEGMVDIALAADAGKPSSLLKKLANKRAHTNVNNIDFYGLAQLAAVVQGIIKSRTGLDGRWTESMQLKLCKACDLLKLAETVARNKNDPAADLEIKKSIIIIREIENELKTIPHRR